MNALALMPHALPLALIGDIGGGELLLVLAAILMLFGGKKVPSIARTIGKTVEDLRRASQDFREQLMNADRELGQPFDDQPPTPLSENRPILPGKRLPKVGPNPALSAPCAVPGTEETLPMEAATGRHDGTDSSDTSTAPVATPPPPETKPRDLAG